MANYASVKRRPKEEAKPSPRTIAHNQRYSQSEDLLPIEHRLENYHFLKVSNATKTFNSWVKENEDRYYAKNERKLRSDAIRLESLAIILSGEQVAKCEPDEIWENALAFKKWFEKRYKTKVRTMDWHRDEGHINEDGKVERNDHIHLEFDNVNEEGKMVRRLFTNYHLVEFQDKIAEIYKPLGFRRGEDTAKKNRSDEPKVGKGQKAWKKKKIKDNLATAADVKKLNTTLRAELQEAQAKAPDYRELEADIKILREQAKTKELTIEHLEALAYKIQKKKVKILNKTITQTVKTGYKELLEIELEKNEKSTPEEKAFLDETLAIDTKEQGQGEERLRAYETKIAKAKQTIKTFKTERETNAFNEEITLVANAPVEIKEKIVIEEDTTRIKELEAYIATQDVALRTKDAQISNLKQKLKEAVSKFTNFVKSFVFKAETVEEIVVAEESVEVDPWSNAVPNSEMVVNLEEAKKQAEFIKKFKY